MEFMILLSMSTILNVTPLTSDLLWVLWMYKYPKCVYVCVNIYKYMCVAFLNK